MPFFDYRVMRVSVVTPIIELPPSLYPDAYISESRDTIALRWLLRNGYRWIRTDGEFAIFEGSFSDYDSWLKWTNQLAEALAESFKKPKPSA